MRKENDVLWGKHWKRKKKNNKRMKGIVCSKDPWEQTEGRGLSMQRSQPPKGKKTQIVLLKSW